MRKKKIHNFILKTEVAMATIGFFVSACMLDNESWIPSIVCALCLAFLGLFVYANREEMQKWN